MGYPFHIVDVFAEKRYTGNQLAVVREAGDLSDDEMARIANEMNYSETTFVESDEPTETGYPVRIFTPNTELPFAGHPTLGTAFVLREAVLGGSGDDSGSDDESDDSAAIDADDIPLSLGVGTVPVTVEGEGDDELFWMRQPDPSFGATIEPEFAAEVVSVDDDDLDPGFAPRIVSTGLPTLIVPCRSLEGISRAGIDDESYERLLDATDAENVLVFCPETVHPENDLHVRVFAPVHGVPEDPATGSSNGCLAAYLARERCGDSSAIDVRVEQGYELDRPSVLYLRASDGGSHGNGKSEEEAAGSAEIDVRVGGRVVPIADGTLV